MPAYSQEHKGKVERAARSHPGTADPTARPWDSLEELQAATDTAIAELPTRRRCPATGTWVIDAWQAERAALAPLPRLPQPFDHVAPRRVGTDALVSFEGRQYLVPFAYLGRMVEVRGGAGTVQVRADQALIAERPRATEQRLLIDPAHCNGPSTAQVKAPPPSGRKGQRLAELMATPVERRPLGLYAALAEVARGASAGWMSMAPGTASMRWDWPMPPCRWSWCSGRRSNRATRPSGPGPVAQHGIPSPGGTAGPNLVGPVHPKHRQHPGRFRLPAGNRADADRDLGDLRLDAQRQTLLIQGPPGVGKTHLAVGLAVPLWTARP